MSLSTKNVLTIFRNYFILALLVMYISFGLTDVFYHPNRLGQQQRLNNYGRFINVGLVQTLQQLIR